MATEKRAETHQYAPIESKGYESVLEGPSRDRSRIRAWLSGCMLALSAVMAVPALAAHYPIHKLHTMVSQPGQDKIAFLVDVAHWLRAYSDRTGYEACGMIATNADQTRYGVNITTSKSHIGCAVSKTSFPDNMHTLNETIHSHPKDGGRYTNESDCLMSGLPSGTKVWNISAKGASDSFSPTDLHSGYSGYLVGVKGVYFQENGSDEGMIAQL